MATTEERLQILKMLEEGKVSAAEAANLLRALDQGKGDARGQPLKGGSEARWFRVRVTDMATGRNKINVNIPMNLVNVGLKMGARFAPNLESAEYQELVEAIRSGQQGKILDVTNSEESERIEIFVE